MKHFLPGKIRLILNSFKYFTLFYNNMAVLKYFVASLFFCSLVFASITLEYPVSKHFDSRNAVKIATYAGDTTILRGEMLGDVSPGQTLALVFSRETGSNFLWDKMQTDKPVFWNEKLSVGDKITLTLNIPKDAAGTYDVNITGTSSYAPGTIKTPEILPVQIQVINSTYESSFPSHFNAIIDYPNSLFFRVKSKSLAPDTITFTISEFPARWAKEVKAAFKPLEEKNLFFAINPLDEKTREYSVAFAAARESGITESTPSTITITPASFSTKLRAMSEGFSLIPILLQPFYSLLSLFGFL